MDMRKQRKDQLSTQQPKQPLPKIKRPPKQKKPQKSAIRSEVLVIRSKEKKKHSEILRRLQNGVPGEQNSSTVDKLRKTETGNVLIILLQETANKGLVLQRTIVDKMLKSP